MPQYLPLPDGNSMEVPEGMDYTAALALAKQQFPVAFRPAPSKETTVGGNIKEAFKGVIPGAVNLLGSAGTGISALLPEAQEKATRETLKSMAESATKRFASAPGYEDSIGRNLGQGVGSMLAVAPLAMLGPVGIGAGVGVGLAAGAGEARERAEAAGATGEQRSTATGLGAIPGGFDTAIDMALAAMPGGTGKALSVVKRALFSGGIEGATETAQKIAQNLIAKGIYKPDQALLEGSGEEGAYGAGVGMLASVLLDMAIPRRKGAPAAKPAAKPAAVPPAVAPTPPSAADKLDLGQRYDDAMKQREVLTAAADGYKGSKDPADMLLHKQAQEAVKEHVQTVLDPLAKEYAPFKAEVAQLRKKQEAPEVTAAPAGALFPEAETPAPITPSLDMFGKPVVPAAPIAAAVEPIDYHQQVRTLTQHMDTLQDQVAAAKDPQQIITLAKQHAAAGAALAEAQAQAGKQAKPVDAQLTDVLKRMAVAQGEGDVAKAASLAQKVLALKEQGAQESTIPLKPFKTTVTPIDPSLRSRKLISTDAEKAANEAALTRQGAAEGEEAEQAIVEQAQAAKVVADEQAAQEVQRQENWRLATGAEQMKGAQQQPLFEAAPMAREYRASLEASGANADQLRATLKDSRARLAVARETGNGAEIAIARKTIQDTIEKLRDLSAPAAPGPVGSEGALKLQQRLDYATPRAEGAARERAPDLIALQDQLAQIPENIHPAQAALLERLTAKLPQVAIDPAKAQIASDWLYRLRLGPQVITEGTATPEASSFRERDVARMLESIKPLRQAAAPVAPTKLTTQTAVEARANTVRQAEQAAAERTAALPGRTVIGETRRQWMAELEAKQAEVDRYQSMIDNPAIARDADVTEASAVTMRDEAKREASELKSKLWRSAVVEKAEKRVAALEGGIEEPGTKKRTLNSRLKLLEQARADLVEAQKTPPKKGGYTVTEKGEAAPQREQQTIADALEIANDKLETAQHEGNARKVAFYKNEIKLLESGKLPARIIGPLVKPSVLAGEMRTGAGEVAAKERATGTRAKITQAGHKRGVTAHQAVVEGNRVSLEREAQQGLDEEALRLKEEAAKDREAVAAAKAAPKLTEKEQDELQAELDAEMKKEDRRGAASKPDDGRTTTPLSAKGIALAEDRQIIKLLEHIAETGSTADTREQAQALSKLLIRTKLEVVGNLTDEKGARVAAYYDPSTNRIMLDRDSLSEEDTLHEAFHAATDRTLLSDVSTLTPRQLQARKELTAMHAAMKDNPLFEGMHATTNVREFVAEIKTNNVLREKMKAVGKPTTLWQRFVNALKRMLKLDDVSKANRLIEDSLQPSKVIKGVPLAPSIFRAKPAAGPLQEFGQYVRDERTLKEKALEVKGSAGLALRQAVADVRASLREALTYGDRKEGDAVSALVTQRDSATNNMQAVAEYGAYGLSKDAQGNRVIGAGHSDSFKDVLEAARDLPGDTAEERINLFHDYRVAKRAEQVGWDKFDFDNPADAESKGQALLARIKADPTLSAALAAVDKPYNDLNRGLSQFLADTHSLPKEVTDAMIADKNYIPFYRANGDTITALMSDGRPVSIGDIRTQPYLKELIGGNKKLMGFSESVMRNIATLTSLGLDNLASRQAAYHLQEAVKGSNKMVIQRGKGKADQDIVRFRQSPDPKLPEDDGWRHVKIDTEGTAMEGIPSHLLVQSIAGTYSTLPSFTKVGAYASDILRSGVTRNPFYVVRQLLKDSVHASLTGNVQATPIIATMKSLRNFIDIVRNQSPEADILRKHGVLHSNVFSGGEGDYNKVARMLAGNQQGWTDRVIATMDRMAMAADAATRTQVYQDMMAKGSSEMEAANAARELMNFNRHGSNSGVQFFSRIIPFFNAGIQGLDVMYRSATGKMPASERMETKQKFFNRAMGMSAMAFAYAMMMDDDPEWKAMTLHQKMANVMIPSMFGDDGEMMKLPIPFETGMAFFSMPVALMEMMRKDFSPADWKAVKDVFVAQLPGSGSLMPQLFKGATDVMRNYNSGLGMPIEPATKAGLDPTQRYTAKTTGAAKEFSKQLNALGVPLSPIQLEYLSNAYLGQLPTMVAEMTNSLFENAAIEKPAGHLSESKVWGWLFQSEIGTDSRTHAYEKANQAEMVQKTFKDLISQNQFEEAKRYREDHKAEFAAASSAGAYKKRMGLLNKTIEQMRNAPKTSGMTPEEKQTRIDRLEKVKQQMSDQYLETYQRIEANVEQGGA